MGYTRSFSKNISVHYSKSVSYPASEHGGSMTVSGYVNETVNVHVHVDTDNFDASVDQCNRDINKLTGAVAATESAQVASIHASSIKISKSIIDGFFKSVKSEVSQQIAALTSNVDSTLIHLKKLAERCVAKQTQMQVDYERLCKRYQKTFDDLNKELENRIYALDEPTFSFSRTVGKYTGQSSDGNNDTVATVAVSGAEEATLTATIAASMAKKRTKDTIGEINRFLATQMATDRVLLDCSLPGMAGQWRYVPAMYINTMAPNGQIISDCFVDGYLQDVQPQVMQSMSQTEYPKMPQEMKASVADFFETELGTRLNQDTPHVRRVRDYMRKFFNTDISNL